MTSSSGCVRKRDSSRNSSEEKETEGGERGEEEEEEEYEVVSVRGDKSRGNECASRQSNFTNTANRQTAKCQCFLTVSVIKRHPALRHNDS